MPLRPLIAAAISLALLVAAGPWGVTAAASVEPPGEPSDIVVSDGVTQPVFSYADAIREVVRVRSPLSSQDSGALDMIYVDIIRPAASDGDLRVPTIIHTSPYFMGWQGFSNNPYGEIKPAPGTPLDFFPRYYDNYFVPRGYAVALVDLTGSRASTGCLDVGGPAEVEALAAVVEWLAGGGHAVDLDGAEVTAGWSSGVSAMIGKSWDGTIPNGVAARATEGLATIVPLVGLTHWHSDFWTNGTRYGGSPTLWHDRHSDNPAMATQCDGMRAHLAAEQNDPDPDSVFWQERDFTKDAGNVEASVFIVSAKNDYNVKPANFARWWQALADHGVPRKMWLSQTAHEEPFDFRRAEWVDTLHRWFDYWLHGIDNGITGEPAVEIEHGPGEWTAYEDWPNGSKASHLWFGRSHDPADPRIYTLRPDARDTEPVTTAHFSEIRRSVTQFAGNQFSEETDNQGRVRRLAFLSDELTKPVHVSGETTVDLEVKIGGTNAQNTTFSALLVDYGAAPQVNHAVSGGILTLPGTTCFGDGTATDTGCYPDTTVRTHTPAFEVVTRGWAQIGFRLGLTALEPGETYRLTFGLQPHDYVFRPGHRIGIVIAGPETHLQNARHPTSNRPVTVHLGPSRVQLPVVGGPPALRDALR
jgi:X-Pro dipeptidyl-peptidase